MWFLRLLFMTAFHTLSAVSYSLFSYTLLSNTKNTWWGGLDNDRYEEQRGYVIQKHDKTRFETNIQTLWVENTYDFYIDIIRWYFYLRRRNDWTILVLFYLATFYFELWFTSLKSKLLVNDFIRRPFYVASMSSIFWYKEVQ